MKTVDDFWKIIGAYNVETIHIQGIFSLFIIGILLFSLEKSSHRTFDKSL